MGVFPPRCEKVIEGETGVRFAPVFYWRSTPRSLFLLRKVPEGSYSALIPG